MTKLTFIPPAGELNAEFLVNKLSVEIVELNNRLNRVHIFKNKEPIQREIRIKREKLKFYKNYYKKIGK